MTSRVNRALAIGPALFFLSGCCNCFVPQEAETTVVVVPSRHDGHVGAVLVTHGKQQRLLNTAYATANSRLSFSGFSRASSSNSPARLRYLNFFAIL